MVDYDFAAPRLHVDAPLGPGGTVSLPEPAAHYLLTVLRLAVGDGVLVFNGRDGEWRATLATATKRAATLAVAERTRAQTAAPDLWLLFAPLKHARLDYLVQKAVEMGAGVLHPVVTRRTQASRVNLERMRANVVEAAEQCGVLALPQVRPPARLDDALAGWPAGRTLVFCDEDAAGDPLAALAGPGGGPLAVLIGPEGGFDPQERHAILALPDTVRLALGPRILRADTAAVAALALVQAARGDWRAA